MNNSAHPLHNQQEFLIAAMGGLGLALAMIAGGLAATGAAGNFLGFTFTNTAIVGGILMLGATALWLIILRPWEKFDDLQTPYYTGHHHDDHAEAHEEAGGQDVYVDDPAAKQATVPREKDNLRIIEGIGPKTQEALYASGIKTFAQVAETPAAELERLVKEEHGVRIVGSTATWPRQAKLATRGDMSGLKDLQTRIKKGFLYDDLTQIEGIGEKIQDALYAAEIRSYDDLAAADESQLRQVLEKAGFSAAPASWPRQAQYIVDEDLTGLKAYQDTLPAQK